MPPEPVVSILFGSEDWAVIGLRYGALEMQRPRGIPHNPASVAHRGALWAGGSLGGAWRSLYVSLAANREQTALASLLHRFDPYNII